MPSQARRSGSRQPGTARAASSAQHPSRRPRISSSAARCRWFRSKPPERIPHGSSLQSAVMTIAILAAGAGDMYCGSCLRDDALAAALIRAGQRVVLVPMYTPLRTEDGSVAGGEVFYGGVNVYLQHLSRI